MLKDIYSNVLVMSLAYVIIAGAFCEWAWVARSNVAVSLVSSLHPYLLSQLLILTYLYLLRYALFPEVASYHLFSKLTCPQLIACHLY